MSVILELGLSPAQEEARKLVEEAAANAAQYGYRR
jgi:anti-sigma regulatory factor (Ser/Thr protein kinase)